MSATQVNRVKKRLLRQAVADNLETIRGLPPRQVRPAHRLTRIWLRRAPLLVIPITLAGSTYLASSNPVPVHDTIHPAKIVVQAAARPKLIGPGRIDSLQRIDTSAFPLPVRRVVIDAGHGGIDPGAIAAQQITEKEVTLDIASRLRALLERDGYEVVITREGDRLIPLRERAKIANQSGSDIFVSIHVNAITKFTASHGVETYYLGPTNDPTLTRLAADENRLSGYSLADMRKLLDGVYADVRREESLRLATAVQRQLFDGLRRVDPGVENWGVKRAPFIVLVATEMPAILAEVGCMSNDGEAAMLHRPDYRQHIAAALFAGIRTYAGGKESPEKKGI